MEKLKKTIKIIMIIIAVALMIDILLYVSMPEDLKKLQSATEEEKEEILEEKYKEFLDGTKDVERYYDTLEDAMRNSKSVDVNISEVLKEIEVDDNYIIIGPSTDKEGTEEFSIARLKIKIDKNGKKKYSNIISATSLESNQFFREEKYDSHLFAMNYTVSNKMVNLEDTARIILEKYPGFVWSLSALEDIKYLEIQGKRPDEVIPFEMDGKTFYLSLIHISEPTRH